MKKSLLMTFLLMFFLLIACAKLDNNVLKNMYDIPYEDLPDDFSLEDAINNDYLVMKNLDYENGEEVFNQFRENIDQKIPCVIRIAFYYTLNKYDYSEEYYEQIKNNYPMLYISELIFDGTKYIFKQKENGKIHEYEYQYLKNELEDSPGEQATYNKREIYYLVNEDVTFKQITSSYLDSIYGNEIKHAVIFSNYDYKYINFETETFCIDGVSFGVNDLQVNNEITVHWLDENYGVNTLNPYQVITYDDYLNVLLFFNLLIEPISIEEAENYAWVIVRRTEFSSNKILCQYYMKGVILTLKINQINYNYPNEEIQQNDLEVICFDLVKIPSVIKNNFIIEDNIG